MSVKTGLVIIFYELCIIPPLVSLIKRFMEYDENRPVKLVLILVATSATLLPIHSFWPRRTNAKGKK